MTFLKLGVLSAFATTLLVGCGGPGDAPVTAKTGSTKPAAPVTSSSGLTGAGSTFVYPVMSKWASAYHEKNNIEVNYQSIGSGGGIQQFTSKVIDFGATDGPMSDAQITQAGGDVLHIPVVIGAVAVAYNLPGLAKPLQFPGSVVADIFLGKITKWNAPAIAAANPGITLPDADIVVVHRSDGSGTTSIFADYLSKISAEWKSKVGQGTSLNWPVGLGGKGNEGVSAQIQRTPNSLGYMELVYALQSKMPVASLINADGQAVAPSPASVTAAAGSLASWPDDLRASITNAAGKDAYPIAGLTWILARTASANPEKNKALSGFVNWILTDEAQAMTADLNYSKLPTSLLEKARAKASLIK